MDEGLVRRSSSSSRGIAGGGFDVNSVVKRGLSTNTSRRSESTRFLVANECHLTFGTQSENILSITHRDYDHIGPIHSMQSTTCRRA